MRRADVSSSHLHALWANYSDAPNPRCASMHATTISSPRERHACRSSAPSATPGGAGECTYNRARARRDVRNAPRCTSRAVPVRSSATVKANGSPTTAVRTIARAARCHAAGRAAARSRGQSSGPGSNQPSARNASGAAQRTRSEGRDAAASSRESSVSRRAESGVAPSAATVTWPVGDPRAVPTSRADGSAELTRASARRAAPAAGRAGDAARSARPRRGAARRRRRDSLGV